MGTGPSPRTVTSGGLARFTVADRGSPARGPVGAAADSEAHRPTAAARTAVPIPRAMPQVPSPATSAPEDTRLPPASAPQPPETAPDPPHGWVQGLIDRTSTAPGIAADRTSFAPGSDLPLHR